jgi:hypothetical protein
MFSSAFFVLLGEPSDKKDAVGTLLVTNVSYAIVTLVVGFQAQPTISLYEYVHSQSFSATVLMCISGN